jgi:hypothetical protein
LALYLISVLCVMVDADIFENMLKLDLAWHVNVKIDLALFVVPFVVNANVSTSRPIGSYFVVFFEYLF